TAAATMQRRRPARRSISATGSCLGCATSAQVASCSASRPSPGTISHPAPTAIPTCISAGRARSSPFSGPCPLPPDCALRLPLGHLHPPGLARTLSGSSGGSRRHVPPSTSHRSRRSLPEPQTPQRSHHERAICAAELQCYRGVSSVVSLDL